MPFLRARGHYQERAAVQRTALAAATRLGDIAAQAISGRPFTGGHSYTSAQITGRSCACVTKCHNVVP